MSHQKKFQHYRPINDIERWLFGIFGHIWHIWVHIWVHIWARAICRLWVYNAEIFSGGSSNLWKPLGLVAKQNSDFWFFWDTLRPMPMSINHASWFLCWILKFGRDLVAFVKAHKPWLCCAFGDDFCRKNQNLCVYCPQMSFFCLPGGQINSSANLCLNM